MRLLESRVVPRPASQGETIMRNKSVSAIAAILIGATVSAWSADYTVINVNNSGAGSLRQALTDANANPGLDRVLFNIPGPGLKIIRVTTAFPDVTGPVEIDGYSQPGSRPNELADADNAVRFIELLGTGNAVDGLTLNAGNSIVNGLALRGFGLGVRVQSSSNLLTGNFIGSSERNFTNGNLIGVQILSHCCNTIGGVEPRHRNVMAGNGGSSIRITPATASVVTSNNSVLGNFLGVMSDGNTGSAIFSSSGIAVQQSANTVIGGLQPGARNIIAAGVGGISVYERCTNTLIYGNHIGVGADGTTVLAGPSGWVGSWGVSIRSVFSVEPYAQVVGIAGNKIAGFRYTGISVTEPPFSDDISLSPQGVTISQNSIFSNGSRSIYLPAETNDFLDLDVGANNRQNYPELSSAGYAGGNTVLAGVLNSAPVSTYRIEFFGNSVPHPSGFGEGEFYLGSTNVTTDFNGSAPFEMTFAGVLALQSYMTATATDAEGNTSMFSRSLQAKSLAAPLFHLNPKPVTALPYTNVVFRADASGAAPLNLQWRRNGIDLPGATNFTLSLSNVVWEDRGTYVLVASNSFGVTESVPAELTVVARPAILVQPTGMLVSPGTNVTFSVQAGGMMPIAYQWRRDGMDIPGANGASLILSNVNWPMRGDYTVSLSNAFGVAESAAASLVVKIRPVIVQQPISQTVVTGGMVTLSVVVSNSATLPLTYSWRSNNLIVATESSMSYVSIFPIGPVKTNAGYRVAIVNAFGASGALSTGANLVVLPDSDGDGLPNAYEDAYGLDRDNAEDAGLDLDDDGVTNAGEYAAGTDPGDALNRLRILQIRDSDGGAEIEFQASSNKTYTVEFREALGQENWQPLRNLPARETNRMELLIDASPSLRRFYRLLTPARP